MSGIFPEQYATLTAKQLKNNNCNRRKKIPNLYFLHFVAPWRRSDEIFLEKKSALFYSADFCIEIIVRKD